MDARTEPPFRADHVGSLLRPGRWCRPVTTPRGAVSTPPACARSRTTAIREVIALQEDIGLRAATDGEFRRTSWHMDFIYQLGGITRTDDEIVVTFRNDEGTGEFVAAGLAVREPLHLDEPIFADDYRFLAGQVRTAMPKMTLPSPNMVLFRSGTPPSTAASTPTSTSSGPTCRPRTPTRSARSPRWAAATCSSTTRASPA